ncbi:MAG TPA: hypothetical protein VMW83_04275 [Spirochaetia bacterium]|nr:hypothetical protein [Spirochaetia bacterium]
MFEKELYNFLLQDIPESIVLIVFCFVFLNLRFKWKQMLIIAALLSLTNLVELLPVALGIRSLMLMVAFAGYIKIFSRASLSKIFIAVFFAFLIELIGDSTWLPLLMSVTGLHYDQVYNTPYLRALFSYPTLLTILAVSYFLYRYKKHRRIDFQ